MRVFEDEESLAVKELLAERLGIKSRICNWDLMQLCSGGLLGRFLTKISPVLGFIFWGESLWESLPMKFNRYLILTPEILEKNRLLHRLADHFEKSGMKELVWFPCDGLTADSGLTAAKGSCISLDPKELRKLITPSLKYVPDTYIFDRNLEWLFCHVHEGFICIAGSDVFIASLTKSLPNWEAFQEVMWKGVFEEKPRESGARE